MATIVYDAEVFPYNWLMGFKIIETGEYVQIWDDHSQLKQFMDNNSTSFFIGFNSSFYDDMILETILKKGDPYDISCRLIDHGEKMYSRLKYHRIDIMEGMAVGTSLKSIESELGMSIEETEVDFHIDRPLTEEEKELTNGYNRHDLDATHRLLTHRWSNFVKTKIDLIKYFNLPPALMRKPFATMVATGLGAKRTSHPPRHFQWYDNLQIENKEVVSFVKEERFLDSNLVFELNGVEHKMGLGGIHGARDAVYYPYFWKVDVKGYYSLIQMNFDLLSRSLPPEGKQAYRSLYDDRLERKAAKDPSADSLKAAILAVWGATLNQYQLLSDISSGNLIMITGQVFMIDLIEKLEAYSELIQTNTDGIFIVPKDEEKCREAIDEWVKRTGFEVEIDTGSKLYQKDVNNYVCLIDGDGITAKGSYVNLYKMQDDNRFFEFRLTYNQSQGTIMDKAVVNYFIYDTPIEETVNNETNPRSFMFTVKKGARSYSHVELHSQNLETEEVEVTKLNRINRVFASKDPNYNRRIYKIKNGTPNLFPNLDTNIFIFNKDLSEFTEADMNNIDREYYIRRAKERVQDFTTAKVKKTKVKKDPVVKLRLYFEDVEDWVPDIDFISFEEFVLELPNGVVRVGDMQVNRMGEWFTFIQKNGKTIILNKEKITAESFDISYGKLRRKRVKVEGNRKTINVIERNSDAIIVYTDKKDSSEDFEVVADSYEKAFELLGELELVDNEVLSAILPDKIEVKKTTSGKTKETFKLDDENWITYESYDLGQGIEYEVGLFKLSQLIKKVDVGTITEALDIVEEWMIEFYS